MREKRQYFRERLRRPIPINILPWQGQEARQSEAWIIDLSFGGALLYSNQQLESGQPLEILLPLNDSHELMKISSKVIRCTRHDQKTTKYAIGISFDKEVREISGILAKNILFTYNEAIGSHLN